MTENGAVTMTTPDDPPNFAAVSDGRPVPWMQLRIVDDENRELPRGRVGRLLVRGAAQCIGYFKRPDLYDAGTTDNGWFDTGYLARMDESGAIRIAGRTKDLIIRGGENVPVLEVEAAIYQMDGVREVAVIGLPDERLGEIGCAVIVPAGAAVLTLEHIRAHLLAIGMAKTFWPERIEIVDQLPKSASGKIQKYRIRQQLSESP
jgi:cyclohexanecarboxylate-CoA ligase